MLSSLLGRLITGPLAFLLAGVYDVTVFFSVFAYRSLLARLRAGAARGGDRSRRVTVRAE